ncbi:unnamed protein product [Strongylus vulgaris]|uniref:Uncharacterized protein n=1 Tax=Strongylus vulgaris TaxID=40348 RepID=A0A3P7J415_STRVU|nr:unnamed protein product [Strongylus vulgaris]
MGYVEVWANKFLCWEIEGVMVSEREAMGAPRPGWSLGYGFGYTGLKCRGWAWWGFIFGMIDELRQHLLERCLGGLEKEEFEKEEDFDDEEEKEEEEEDEEEELERYRENGGEGEEDDDLDRFLLKRLEMTGSVLLAEI